LPKDDGFGSPVADRRYAAALPLWGNGVLQGLVRTVLKNKKRGMSVRIRAQCISIPALVAV